MLAAFGKPDFDKERMVWDIHIRYYAFPHGYEVGVAVDGRGNRKIFHAMEVTDLYRYIVPRDDR